MQKNDIDRIDRKSNFDKLMQMMMCQQQQKGGTLIASGGSVGSGGLANSSRISKEQIRNIKSVQQLTLNNIEIPNQNDIVSMPEISTVDTLTFDIEKLKQSIEQCVVNRKTLSTKLNDIKEQKTNEEQTLAKLRDEKKIKERTHLLLQNPEVNMEKMGTVLKATEERMQQLEAQWQEHRAPLVEQLERANQLTSEQSVRVSIIQQKKMYL